MIKHLMTLLLVMSFSHAADAAKTKKRVVKKKKPFVMNMTKVQEDGNKKALELKEKTEFNKQKWATLTDSEKKTLAEKVKKMTPEERKAFREQLDTISAQDLKSYIRN